MLNETPIRTNKGYNINNSKINFKIPKNSNKFNNIKITSENIEILEGVEKLENLTYGMGEEIFENSKNNCNHGITLKTNKQAKADIIYDFDNQNYNLTNNIYIDATYDLDLTIMYKFGTEETKECFLNSLLKIDVKNNAKVNVNIINLLNEQSNDLITVEGNVLENSKLTVNVIDLGSLNSLQNIYLNAKDANSNVKINSMYMGNNEEYKDLNYITHLVGKESLVNIDVIGSLNENSQKNFKGTIDFKKGCVKAVGKEKEHCLLLSKKAISKALPMLLCSEENVEGEHSSSSGSIDESQIYYIMSRGFNKQEAIRLLVRGKFNSILKLIDNENYIEEINKEIDRRLI